MRVDQSRHHPRAIEVDDGVEQSVARRDDPAVAHADRVEHLAVERRPDPTAREERAGHQLARSMMRTTPAVPSTSIMSPVRMRVVAKPVPHTAGMRYSRETIAV